MNFSPSNVAIQLILDLYAGGHTNQNKSVWQRLPLVQRFQNTTSSGFVRKGFDIIVRVSTQFLIIQGGDGWDHAAALL